MGLIDNILGKLAGNAYRFQTRPYWSTFTEYSPTFTTYDGGIYEQELTRAAIERFAQSCSKLKPCVQGSAKAKVRRAIETTPNSYMTWPTFLARAATILKCDTTCAIVPCLDKNNDITGFWPLKFATAEIVDYNGTPWVRFNFETGAEPSVIELERVCFLTRFQYKSDFFGDGNVLDRTMKLIDAQGQAEDSAIKNGAKIRFIGKMVGMQRPEDIERKRAEFSEDNLSSLNQSGLLVYDQAFDNITQVNQSSYVIDPDEMARIEKNVYTYFGINEDILLNHYTEDVWGAYYEGEIEPFAVQLGDGLTQMCYTEREQRGENPNRISFSANRLEYASNASKRNMVRDMLDRGVMTLNEGREVLQLPPIEGGDVFLVRGEYYILDKNLKLLYSSGGIENQANTDSRNDPDNGSYAETDFDLGGDDDIYNETDARGDKEADE